MLPTWPSPVFIDMPVTEIPSVDAHTITVTLMGWLALFVTLKVSEGEKGCSLSYF